jgi:hypothetical protein
MKRKGKKGSDVMICSRKDYGHLRRTKGIFILVTNEFFLVVYYIFAE